MGIVIAMAVLAFLAFVAMLGAKTETVCNNAVRVCIGALIATVLCADPAVKLHTGEGKRGGKNIVPFVLFPVDELKNLSYTNGAVKFIWLYRHAPPLTAEGVLREEYAVYGTQTRPTNYNICGSGEKSDPVDGHDHDRGRVLRAL